MSGESLCRDLLGKSSQEKGESGAGGAAKRGCALSWRPASAGSPGSSGALTCNRVVPPAFLQPPVSQSLAGGCVAVWRVGSLWLRAVPHRRGQEAPHRSWGTGGAPATDYAGRPSFTPPSVTSHVQSVSRHAQLRLPRGARWASYHHLPFLRLGRVTTACA